MEALAYLGVGIAICVGLFAVRLMLRSRFGISLEQALVWIEQAELVAGDGNGRFDAAGDLAPTVYMTSETGDAYYFLSEGGGEVRESIEIWNSGALGGLVVCYVNGQPTSYHGPNAMFDGMQAGSHALAVELLKRVRSQAMRAAKLKLRKS